MRSRYLLVAAGLLLAGCSTGAPDAPVNPVPTVPPTAVSAPPAFTVAGRPVRVAIPQLGVIDEIVPVGIAPDGSMDVPPVDKTGWFDLGPAPGSIGPAVLAGHVNYGGQLGALGRIGELKQGDLVIVTDTTGIERTFAVDQVVEIPKSQYAQRTVPKVFGDTTGPELRLVTCSGTVRDHQYDSNMIAVAHLIT